MKVLYDDGTFRRENRNHITKKALRPAVVPKGKSCQSLSNEVKLQLKRLDREIDFIEADIRQVHDLLHDIERSTSPDSVVENNLYIQGRSNSFEFGLVPKTKPAHKLGQVMPILPPDTSNFSSLLMSSP